MFRLIIVGEVVVLLVVAGVLVLRAAGGKTASTPPSPPPAEPPGGFTLVPDPPLPPEQGLAPRDETSSPAPPPARPAAPARRPLGPLRRPRVLVEKSALRLTLFDGEVPVRTYRAAVGARAGDKQVEGDEKTPEGTFTVCIHKGPGQTPYHRSLGLDYPHIEDAERGLRAGLISRREYDRIVHAIRRGQRPPWDTALGGAIMIHGARDGRTGTKGCIALDDEAIEELFPLLPLGTPVEIVP